MNDPVVEMAGRLNDYGTHLRNKNLHLSSLSVFKRASNLLPNDSSLLNNVAAALWSLGRFEEAEIAVRKAYELNPTDLDVLTNISLVLYSQDKWAEAEQYIEKLSDTPKALESKMDYAFMDLKRGKWKEGLEKFESRIKYDKWAGKYQKMPVPFWTGQNLNGKTLFIYAEQGFGDMILFSRYLHWVKKKYPRSTIKVCCDWQLFDLFWDFRNIVEFIPYRILWADVGADYGLFLASLPYMHGTTIKNIYPDPGLIRKRVERQIKLIGPYNLPTPNLPTKVKVGICWGGNPKQLTNDSRSIPLELFLPLAENPDIVLYSLQCGEPAKDLKRLDVGDLICDLSPDLMEGGFVRTAMAMKEMDLVITVCTSVAHLAGAVGVPCWVLLNSDPYWIHLRRKIKSVWFPSWTLIRAKKMFDWSDVMEEVITKLNKYI